MAGFALATHTPTVPKTLTLASRLPRALSRTHPVFIGSRVNRKRKLTTVRSKPFHPPPSSLSVSSSPCLFLRLSAVWVTGGLEIALHRWTRSRMENHWEGEGREARHVRGCREEAARRARSLDALARSLSIFLSCSVLRDPPPSPAGANGV